MTANFISFDRLYTEQFFDTRNMIHDGFLVNDLEAATIEVNQEGGGLYRLTLPLTRNGAPKSPAQLTIKIKRA